MELSKEYRFHKKVSDIIKHLKDIYEYILCLKTYIKVSVK